MPFELIHREVTMISFEQKKMLEQKALQFRLDILKMLYLAGSGHTGGSLSAIDMLTVLYYYKMHYNPANPQWEDRDRFILSKGHGCPAQYVILADLGYFPKEELSKLRKINGILQGHPDMLKTPGLEASTGSLGQGLSIGNGIAMAGKLDKKSYRIYVMLGDGECQEGQVWEAAMTAAHYQLDNLCAMIDYNGLQIDGKVMDIKSIDPLVEKWISFGWETIYIDGHDFNAIAEALDYAETIKNKPTMIVAKTVKGKGVSFMENKCHYHGVAPTEKEYNEAVAELIKETQ
jgi:transketolase